MDYNTRKLLGLTDNNIHFTQDWLSEKNYRGTTANVISGKLSYRPLCCEKCGEINQNQIICNGTVQTTTQLPVFNYQLTFLQLNRTRFLCYSCGATFVAQTPLVERNHHISKSLKYQIAIDLKKVRSRKTIAADHFVSDITITRIQTELAKSYRINLNYLPQTICLDEFKSMKSCSGSMSFICIDGDNGQLL
jgi:transposase